MINQGFERFNCNKCDYSTYKKSSWNKHIKTKKHKKNIAIAKKKGRRRTNLPKDKKFKCIYCEKSYSHRSTLSTHKKTCKKYTKQNKFEEQEKVEEIESESTTKQIKSLIKEVQGIKTILLQLIELKK